MIIIILPFDSRPVGLKPQIERVVVRVGIVCSVNTPFGLSAEEVPRAVHEIDNICACVRSLFVCLSLLPTREEKLVCESVLCGLYLDIYTFL